MALNFPKSINNLIVEILDGKKLTIHMHIFHQGKGKHASYWLTGKDGFDKQLPEPMPENRYVFNIFHFPFC